MHMHGIVQTAILEENPPGSESIEMVLVVQGVGRDQPRKIIIPFDLLLRDESLDVDRIQGHAFQAEVDEDGPKRWVVREIAFAGHRIL